MPSVFTQAQLQQLRAGDRVTYGGVQWQVADYADAGPSASVPVRE